jgi:uncharacterized protein (TIGR03435 family)
MNVLSAVLNSLWQASAVAVLVRLAIARLNAATRHVIWWIALAAIVALPFVPPISLHDPPPPPPPAAVRSAPIHVAPPFVAPQLDAPVTVTEVRRPVWSFALLGVFFLYRVVRLARDYYLFRGMKRRSTMWTHPLPALRRTAVPLLSTEIFSPIAVGFLHPAVILPADLPAQLTPVELNDVLLHECAHLARYDDWTNLIARALGTVLALHPVAWWVLRRIDRERELACDDWVVAHTGAPRAYAAHLARVVELRLQPAPALATGIFTNRSRLRCRIEILLRSGRVFSTAAARIPLVAAAMALVILVLAGALAPHWIAFAQRLEFAVASVKVHPGPGQIDSAPHRSGDLVTMHNTRVYTALYWAWHLHGAYQVVGYPDTAVGMEWYDFDARIGRDATDDEVRLMMQSLLEDRFKLKVHHETREVPEFELTMPKGKHKLKPSDSKEPLSVTIENRTYPQRAGRCDTTLWLDGAHMVCHSAPIEQIAATLGAQLRSPVADRTGISGTYDLHIRFARTNGKVPAEADPDNPPPTLEQAVQEELGLKLEKGKGAVEVLVIDHLEKPSGN